jgi:hypothetical protein
MPTKNPGDFGPGVSSLLLFELLRDGPGALFALINDGYYHDEAKEHL